MSTTPPQAWNSSKSLGGKMKKKLKIGSQAEGEDRLSSLSDDVIHQILSFLGTRVAVQTSILSKRWKHIWTTLPFLTFDGYDQLFPFTHSGIIKFINHVLSHRNHQLNVSSFKFFALYPIPQSLLQNVIEYTILHNVQNLDLDLLFQRHHPFNLSAFSSNSIQKLRLGVCLDFSKLWESGGCWDLPVLETLHLVCPIFKSKLKVPLSCLMCLPALTTLHLERCEFPEFVPMCLPGLTTLTMARCKLPPIVWDFPALLSLELDDVLFPRNMIELFSALVSLRNLTIIFPKKFVQKYFIHSSQLVNLKICTRTSTCITPTRKIEVWAPRLQEIYCVGIFQVRLLVNELENANVDVLDTTEFHNLTLSRKKVFFHRLRRMFWQLGSTKILTIDSATFEVLSAFTNFVEDVASPFYNLKYVKLPKGYKESSISTTMRKFLLGCSPGATIVTGLPQNEEYYQAVHVPSTSQKLLEEPLTTPTAELVDSQDIHKKVCVNGVQVEHLVDSSVGDADRARHAGAPVARKSINQASSSRGNSNFWLWQGLEIKSEFVDLLDLIVKKYPQTFEHFTAKSETFYAMKLNMLCTWVNEFLRTSMPEFCTDIISEYKDGFADLQRWGFNVYWLVDRLNYIEQIRLSQNEVHAIDSSVGDADRARHAGTPVAREGIDQASSSRGNSNFWLWQGLEIKSEFVGLLDLIMKKYPETFEHFTAKSEAFYAMKLNVLCTWVDDFLRTSMPEFFTDIISEYKDGFADLQRWGFNVNWLVDHLNYIEQIRLSQNEVHAIDYRTGDDKSKLQDLLTYCLENIEI